MTETLEERFHRLAKFWNTTILVTSDLDSITESSYYKEIVAMGEKALPLIFDLYKAAEAQQCWYYALGEITKEDPVAEKMKEMGIEILPGNRLDFINSCWLKWGREKGYLENKVEGN